MKNTEIANGTAVIEIKTGRTGHIWTVADDGRYIVMMADTSRIKCLKASEIAVK